MLELEEPAEDLTLAELDEGPSTIADAMARRVGARDAAGDLENEVDAPTVEVPKQRKGRNK